MQLQRFGLDLLHSQTIGAALALPVRWENDHVRQPRFTACERRDGLAQIAISLSLIWPTYRP
jgi:hypothetical protein